MCADHECLKEERHQRSAAIAVAVGICVLYAISDEVHQLFVPGRSGQFKDVFLDSGGAIVGAALYRLFVRRG